MIAKNAYFRPDDNVTQIEALKMIMQARDMSKAVYGDDWREAYNEAAIRDRILDNRIVDYNANAYRGWIFSIAAKTFTNKPAVVQPY